MKYFLDTEFLEGTQNIYFPYTNIFIRKTKPTIDLISIGIVAEDGRKYYAISKDFNLKEAWNRVQINTHLAIGGNVDVEVYWIRENVLKPIFCELAIQEAETKKKYGNYNNLFGAIDLHKEDFKEFKRLINKYGKSNKQIAEEIKQFCHKDYWINPKEYNSKFKDLKDILNIQFYAYFADYDWVVFCWLFGSMNNLPKSFPKYCIDLKQILDEKASTIAFRDFTFFNPDTFINTLENRIKTLKKHPNYPKQTNEHNALADAEWNFELYKFLDKL